MRRDKLLIKVKCIACGAEFHPREWDLRAALRPESEWLSLSKEELQLEVISSRRGERSFLRQLLNPATREALKKVLHAICGDECEKCQAKDSIYISQFCGKILPIRTTNGGKDNADVRSEKLLRNISDACEYYFQANPEVLPESEINLNKLFNLPKLHEQEHIETRQQLETKSVLDSLQAPGKLVHLHNNNDITTCNKVIDDIWRQTDWDEIWDDWRDGRYGGCGYGDEMREFFDRARLLKPVLVLNKPDTETRQMFSEAMRLWCYGFDKAALILCDFTIECCLRSQVLEKDKRPTFCIKERRDLISHAFQLKLIDDNDHKRIQMIWKYRNKAAHQKDPISAWKIYELIKDTQSLMRRFLKG